MDERAVRILLADDDAITALSITEYFALAGFHTIKTVSSGEEVLRAVEEWKPDILFIDIQLSGQMNGIESAERIREKSGLPIAFITGFYSEEHRKRAEKLSPIACLEKPIFMQQLVELVTKHAIR